MLFCRSYFRYFSNVSVSVPSDSLYDHRLLLTKNIYLMLNPKLVQPMELAFAAPFQHLRPNSPSQPLFLVSFRAVHRMVGKNPSPPPVQALHTGGQGSGCHNRYAVSRQKLAFGGERPKLQHCTRFETWGGCSQSPGFGRQLLPPFQTGGPYFGQARVRDGGQLSLGSGSAVCLAEMPANPPGGHWLWLYQC